MKEMMRGTCWRNILRGKTVEQQWSEFTTRLPSAVDRCVPHKSFDSNGAQHKRPAWMNERVLARIKKKKSTFECFRQTRDGKDYLEYARARNAARTETRRAVRDC